MKRFYLFCNSSLTVGIVWSQSQLHSQVGVLSTKLSSKLQGILVPVWLQITKLPLDNFYPVMATKSRIKNVPQNAPSHKNYGYGTTAASISIPQQIHKYYGFYLILIMFYSQHAERSLCYLQTNVGESKPNYIPSVRQSNISL